MWVSIQGQVGALPIVRGPVRDFQAAAGDVASLGPEHRAVIVEWLLGAGCVALWERRGECFLQLWESGAADELRAAAELPGAAPSVCGD